MTYPRPLRMVHWTVAILVTCQLAIAVVMTQLQSLAYGQLVLTLHRQLGLVILLLMLARLVIGLHHRAPPQLKNSMPAWQTRAATLVHRTFWVLLVAQPLIGLCEAWARGDAVTLFGLIPLPAPGEFSDLARERLMTLHTGAAVLLLSLCVLHIAAVGFNRLVRGVSVVDRMLPPIPTERLVNRVRIGTQLALAFGVVIAIALVMGLNAVSTYRTFLRSNAAFQAGDVAVGDQMRQAQVAWKELIGTAALNRAGDAGHLRELSDVARSSLEDAASHAGAGDVKSGLPQLLEAVTRAVPADSPPNAEALHSVDSQLQDLVDYQSGAAFQHRTENDEKAARGHDLIVVTVLPMILTGLICGLLFAHSVTGSLSRMSSLIRNIESDQREAAVQVVGRGEFASLTRNIVSMRAVVEERGNAAAAQRAEFDAERARLLEQQQERDRAAELAQRIERGTNRSRLAGDFELQITAIVDTVARTAQELTTTAGSMAVSASATTGRSRDASSVAEQTSGTASKLASGAAELSSTAHSVRENAEQSKARAAVAVREATAAKEHIDHLVAAARQISSITDLIAGVARQTNLLAINARIEAARVGDAGMGFAVVANEVKVLANQTRDATNGIGKQIEQVNAAAARSSESLQRLREVIEGLESSAAAIFVATDRQFESTREIAVRVSEISASTTSVARDIRGAQDTAATTEGMSADVVQAADVMDEQALHLRDRVAQFVLQLRSNSVPTAVPAAFDVPAARASSG